MGHGDISRDPLGQPCLWDRRVRAANLIHGIFPSTAGSMSNHTRQRRALPYPTKTHDPRHRPPRPANSRARKPGTLLSSIAPESSVPPPCCIRVPPRARPVHITRMSLSLSRQMKPGSGTRSST